MQPIKLKQHFNSLRGNRTFSTPMWRKYCILPSSDWICLCNMVTVSWNTPKETRKHSKANDHIPKRWSPKKRRKQLRIGRCKKFDLVSLIRRRVNASALFIHAIIIGKINWIDSIHHCFAHQWYLTKASVACVNLNSLGTKHPEQTHLPIPLWIW